MQVPEYDLKDESTWVVIPSPTVDSSFLGALKELGGLNPHGQCVLKLVWGATHVDPQDASNGLKYFLCDSPAVLKGFEFTLEGKLQRVKTLAEVPASVLVPVPKYESVQLGERRFIVEEWRSPEFLVRTGRFRQTHDTGESEIKISCRNCGGPMQPTGQEDERVCLSCGSKRQSVVETREIKNERLLKDLPREGCYDFFMRLETSDGLYHPPDGEMLKKIRQEWERRKKSSTARTAEVATLRSQAATRTKQNRRAIWHPDQLLKKEYA